MKTSKKLTGLLLTFVSFGATQASENICPPITGHQLSTVCLTTQVERVGVDAGEIVVGGVRLLNNKSNCSTLTSVTATLKKGKDPIPGTFIAMHGVKKPGGEGTAHVEIKGKCVYTIPKLLGGSQKVEFDITTTQKLIEGKRINPMATKTPPRIGEVKVDNPPEHEKKAPILGIFKKKDATPHSTDDQSHHKDEDTSSEGQTASPTHHPVVTQHQHHPEIIDDYKGGAQKPPRPTRPIPEEGEHKHQIGNPENMRRLPNPPEIEEAIRAHPKPSSTAEKQQLEKLRENPPREELPPVPSDHKPSSQPPSRKPPLRPGEVDSSQRPQLPPRPVRPEPVTVPEKPEKAEVPTDLRSELEKHLEKRKALAEAQNQ